MVAQSDNAKLLLGIDFQDPDFQTDISACQAESGLDFGPPGTGGGVAG